MGGGAGGAGGGGGGKGFDTWPMEYLSVSSVKLHH